MTLWFCLATLLAVARATEWDRVWSATHPLERLLWETSDAVQWNLVVRDVLSPRIIVEGVFLDGPPWQLTPVRLAGTASPITDEIHQFNVSVVGGRNMQAAGRTFWRADGQEFPQWLSRAVLRTGANGKTQWIQQGMAGWRLVDLVDAASPAVATSPAWNSYVFVDSVSPDARVLTLSDGTAVVREDGAPFNQRDHSQFFRDRLHDSPLLPPFMYFLEGCRTPSCAAARDAFRAVRWDDFVSLVLDNSTGPGRWLPTPTGAVWLRDAHPGKAERVDAAVGAWNKACASSSAAMLGAPPDTECTHAYKQCNAGCDSLQSDCSKCNADQDQDQDYCYVMICSRVNECYGLCDENYNLCQVDGGGGIIPHATKPHPPTCTEFTHSPTPHALLGFPAALPTVPFSPPLQPWAVGLLLAGSVLVLAAAASITAGMSSSD